MARAVAALLVLLAALFGSPAAAFDALVIGADYRSTIDTSIKRLPNAAGDARLMAATFRRMNAVSVEELIEPSYADIAAAADRITARRTVDPIVIYLAGHGVQVDGVNYFVLPDASFLRITTLLERMRVGRRPLVVFLDACRDNPWAGRAMPMNVTVRSWSRRRVEATRDTGAIAAAPPRSGLADISNVGRNVLLVYATAANGVASDGRGDNGPFAASLSRRLFAAQPITELLPSVVRDVSGATNDRQIPYTYGSLEQNVILVRDGPSLRRPPFQMPG